MIDLAVATDRATPGLDRDMLGDWILRNSKGETGRANSAAPLGDPGAAIGDAVDHVEAWYRDRGRSPLFQMFDEASPVVVAELAARGYVDGAVTDVLSAALAPVRDRLKPPNLATEIVATMPPFLRDQLNDARAAEMVCADLPRWFAIASEGAEVLASGMALGDDELVGVFAMRTHLDAQGRGAGSAVLAALLDEGARRGATTAWLQVEASNDRARSWYERLGVERTTGYRYRRLEDT